jgi:hypothetical protein
VPKVFHDLGVSMEALVELVGQPKAQVDLEIKCSEYYTTVILELRRGS